MNPVHALNMLAYSLDAVETEPPWDRWEWRRDVPPSEQKCWGPTRHSIDWMPHMQYRRKKDAPALDWDRLNKMAEEYQR